MEWMEYELREPFGDKRRDWQAAAITAGISNVLLQCFQYEHRFKVSDFMLKFGIVATKEDAPSGKSWQEMKMIAQMMTVASQAKKRRR
jgi:hypothetical protein